MKDPILRSVIGEVGLALALLVLIGAAVFSLGAGISYELYGRRQPACPCGNDCQCGDDCCCKGEYSK
jgi:hypothetical protein